MRSFLKFFLACLVALIVFVGIGIVFLFVLVSAISSPSETIIEPKSVLVVDLSQAYQERQTEDPFVQFMGSKELVVPKLSTLLSIIQQAGRDKNISGIYLKCSGNANGFAASEEIRRALRDFRSNRKFIIAYGETIGQSAYYIATAADQIYTNPKGGVDWRGYATQFFFLKNALDKLQIEPQIFYAGKFKSATEPFREEQITPANRLQTQVWLEDLYRQLLVKTSEARKIDTATLHRYADELSVKTANDALNLRLVDGLKYDDEVKSEIRKRLGITEEQTIEFVHPGTYEDVLPPREYQGDRIAVIYAEGEIVNGSGRQGQIGADEYKSLIHRLVIDKSVKAIVMRINSPGGSSFASEVIWRELSLARKYGKPYVVSMGDVAASGGYYIACHADRIFAEPGTITGSIGVFGIVPNVEKFMRNKLGVTFDEVKTSPFADIGNPFREMTQQEKSLIQAQVDTIYLDFKRRVADGRKKDLDDVDSVAQGRVWTGVRALDIGLVDRLGSLSDAVAEAAKLARLSKYAIREYPADRSFYDILLSNYKKNVKTEMLQDELGVEEYRLYQQIKRLKDMSGEIQARMPFDFSVK